MTDRALRLVGRRRDRPREPPAEARHEGDRLRPRGQPSEDPRGPCRHHRRRRGETAEGMGRPRDAHSAGHHRLAVRTYTSPVSAFIKKYRENNGSAVVTVYLPQFIVGHWWESILHNRRSRRLAHQLMLVHGVSITLVPGCSTRPRSSTAAGRVRSPVSSAVVSPWPRPRRTRRGRRPPTRHPEPLPNAPPLRRGRSAFRARTGGRWRAELLTNARFGGGISPADAARAKSPEFGPLAKQRVDAAGSLRQGGCHARPRPADPRRRMMVIALIDAITRREPRQVKHLPRSSRGSSSSCFCR